MKERSWPIAVGAFLFVAACGCVTAYDDVGVAIYASPLLVLVALLGFFGKRGPWRSSWFWLSFIAVCGVGILVGRHMIADFEDARRRAYLWGVATEVLILLLLVPWINSRRGRKEPGDVQ